MAKQILTRDCRQTLSWWLDTFAPNLRAKARREALLVLKTLIEDEVLTQQSDAWDAACLAVREESQRTSAFLTQAVSASTVAN